MEYRVSEWRMVVFSFFVFLLESNGPGMISPTHRVYKYAARAAGSTADIVPMKWCSLDIYKT